MDSKQVSSEKQENLKDNISSSQPLVDAFSTSQLNRLLDYCIPDAVLLDASQVFQARTLVFFTLILSFFAVIGVTSIIIVEQSFPLRRIITICLITCLSLPLFVMRKKRRVREAALLFIFFSIVLVAYVDFMTRSLEGPSTILWVVPYAIAAIFLGAKLALVVAAASTVIIILNAALLKFDLLPLPLNEAQNWVWLRLIFALIVISTVAFCVYGLARLEKQRRQELSYEIQLNKEIMSSLETATIEAQAAARSKELFLATMSHELRTPLNGVLGNAQLLAKEVENLNAKARVESITASGELLLSIINDVLEFSKFESQGVSLKPQGFDVSLCLRQLYRLIKPRIHEGVDFSLTGVDDPLFIFADENRLSQVVLNLLSNAAKFTEQGHIALSISLLSDEHLKIQVSDTGNGISEVNQKRLFQDFVQVGEDTKKHMEGTGLGLAITRRIIDRMQGDIQVYSTLGKGTTMVVYLPVQIVEAPELESAPSILPSLQSSAEFSKLRVLIVDDVEMNCMMLEGMLESLEVTDCQIERDGSTAVESVKKDNGFDLILMDVRMPTMDGLEATRQIRNLGYSKPIIAVTANAFDEDRDKCLEAGMNYFLAKPLHLEALQEVLVEALT